MNYPFIRIWGAELQSFGDYIQRQVEIAREEGAPWNAIYRDSDGEWRTVDNIKGEERQLAMYKRAAQMAYS